MLDIFCMEIIFGLQIWLAVEETTTPSICYSWHLPLELFANDESFLAPFPLAVYWKRKWRSVLRLFLCTLFDSLAWVTWRGSKWVGLTVGKGNWRRFPNTYITVYRTWIVEFWAGLGTFFSLDPFESETSSSEWWHLSIHWGCQFQWQVEVSASLWTFVVTFVL